MSGQAKKHDRLHRTDHALTPHPTLPRMRGRVREGRSNPSRLFACYSGAGAMATGTSLPVLGAGFAHVRVPRTLAAWVTAWDSVTESFS